MSEREVALELVERRGVKVKGRRERGRGEREGGRRG